MAMACQTSLHPFPGAVMEAGADEMRTAAKAAEAAVVAMVRTNEKNEKVVM